MRRRLDTFGIIQFQIKAQVQRLIESLAQIIGYTIDTAVVVVHDSGFAVLVSTHFCISADNILRESLKELVARDFRATINYRLNEKFFVSRQ